MRRLTLFGLALTLVGCHASPSEPGGGRAARSARATLLLENVTLVDVRTGAQERGVTIGVAGERIVSIGPTTGAPPADARVLDGTGMWVVPGFVDVHVHDISEAYLRDLLAWGVTAAHVMPSPAPEDPDPLEERSESPDALTPRLQLTEMFAGAFPDNLFPGAYQFIKPATVDEAREAVRASHERGYRQIKIIRDDSFQWSGESYRVPMMPAQVFDALVAEAHALEMRVYVHATQREVAISALSAGTDAFLHATMDVELTSEDWRAMNGGPSAWAPTVNAIWAFGDQRAYARRALADARFAALLEEAERAALSGMAESEDPILLPPTTFLVENTATYAATIGANTRRAQDAGVPVAVGTDGGPGGISTHIELELLQAGGLTPTEVLAAATWGGAVALGRQAELGAVEVGRLADLVVLRADPTEDARNCREIEWVIKGGAVHRPRDLALEP